MSVPGPAGSGPARALRLVRNGEAPEPPPDPPTLTELTEEREARRREIEAGEPHRVAQRRDAGRRTARERLDLLLDPGSFHEIGAFRTGSATGPGSAVVETDGVVTGSGTVDGHRVFVFAQDATVLGGSLGAAHAAKIHRVMELAVSTRAPLVGLHDSGGARIQEGAAALDGYGGIFRRSVAASGVIPQIAVLLGPCAGGAAYAPALADVVVMVRGLTRMYLTGPDVVRQVTGAEVTHEELGGADMHGTHSGLAHVVADDEETALDDVRTLVGLLPPDNVTPAAVRVEAGDGDDHRPRLRRIVPTDPATPYDVCTVIEEIVDAGDHFELCEEFAPNVVTTLARVRGELVAIVANQPSVLAGVLDRAASEKAARFVRFCDSFGIPLVSLVDVPGFLPGLDQERQAVIRHGAQLLYAYCDATVPRISVVLRKAYGGAYIVMDSRSVGCDLALAWPTNEVAVLGAESAVDVLFRRELAESDEPENLRREYEHTYRERYLHPDHAAEQGLVDDVIDPADTRSAIVDGLAMLRSKRPTRPDRRHGNIPL